MTHPRSDLYRKFKVRLTKWINNFECLQPLKNMKIPEKIGLFCSVLGSSISSIEALPKEKRLSEFSFQPVLSLLSECRR